VPSSVIPPAITLAGVAPVGAVPIRLVLLPLDGGGFSALGSGFNI
jgi:hypothetical protein